MSEWMLELQLEVRVIHWNIAVTQIAAHANAGVISISESDAIIIGTVAVDVYRTGVDGNAADHVTDASLNGIGNGQFQWISPIGSSIGINHGCQCRECGWFWAMCS